MTLRQGGEGGSDGAEAPSPPNSGVDRHEDPLASWVADAAAGDGAAMRKLLQAVTPRVLSIARRILGRNDPDVDDAAQESLVGLARALPSFRGDSSVIHYATRIAVLTCLRWRKRRAARQDREHEAPASALSQSPSDLAQSAQRREAMRQLLSTIPTEQAETLVMRFVLGLSLEEVGRMTGAPVNTVRSRVRLARQTLQKKIDQDARWSELVQ